jgi:hypothetical protein
LLDEQRYLMLILKLDMHGMNMSGEYIRRKNLYKYVVFIVQKRT